MKTFGTCSDCSKEHYWREIDYDNMLYINSNNAVCITMCPTCVSRFLSTQDKKESISTHKEKITSMLKGKSKPIFDFNLGNQSNLSLWPLSF